MAQPPILIKPPPPSAAVLADKAYSLDALRTAVDDAAKASGPLWVSYILALFYFLIAAGGVTHKDMFLERPVKLPFLGVDLPIAGFFIVAPPVFVLLHGYVLVAFAVLARKVAAFDAVLREQVANTEQGEALRRQLPSSPFVQYWAGPRELRRGVVGAMLHAVAIVSLMLGPVVLLLFLQLQFLPYHSHGATWSARLSLYADLVLLWLMWRRLQMPPLTSVRRGIWQFVERLPGYLARALCCAGTFAALWLAFRIGTFPGEPLDDLGRGWMLRDTLIDGVSYLATEDGTILVTETGQPLITGDPMAGIDKVSHLPTTWFTNRLILMGFDIAEDSRFDSKEKYEIHSVTFSLRAHDLRRAVLSNSDLRKADLTGAILLGAILDGAKLEHAKLDGAQMQVASLDRAEMEGASFNGAHMQGASLDDARMQGASLNGAQMEGASLNDAQMQGASLNNAEMQGASLNRAKMQGAWLFGAGMQGASLDNAEMQGASLYVTQMQGASLNYAEMQGASLFGTQMQGASLNGAQMQGAWLLGVQMQGVDLTQASLDNAILDRPALWRAQILGASSPKAFLSDPLLDRVAGDGRTGGSIPTIWTHEDFTSLQQQLQHAIPVGDARARALKQIARLDPDVAADAHPAILDAEAAALEAFGTQQFYQRFSGATRTVEDFDWPRWAQELGDLGCSDDTPPFLVARLAGDFVVAPPKVIQVNAQRALAKRFTDRACTGAVGLAPDVKKQLADAAKDPAPTAQ